MKKGFLYMIVDDTNTSMCVGDLVECISEVGPGDTAQVLATDEECLEDYDPKKGPATFEQLVQPEQCEEVGEI
jgi:hypothetical protein